MMTDNTILLLTSTIRKGTTRTQIQEDNPEQCSRCDHI